MTRLGWYRLAIVAGAVAGLEVLCRAGIITRLTMVPPTEMAAALWEILISGSANRDIARTLVCVAAAFALSASIGFALGLVIHQSPRLRRALDPFFATYYAVPFFVFYPVLVAIFGLTAGPVIVIGFLFAVVAMVINTLNGLDRIPRVLRTVAATHRMRRLDAALSLELPAAAPHLFTGIKLAVAYSFIGVIASEFIMAASGLGYAIAYAYNNFDNRRMYALMLFVLVVVTVVNLALHGWEQRLLRRRQGR